MAQTAKTFVAPEETAAKEQDLLEALRESEARYRILVEQASDGIFLANQQGNYVSVNESGCTMLGYTREELLALNMKDLVTQEELGQNPLRFDELFTGKTLIVERWLCCKDGQLLPVEISAKLLPNGQLQGIVRDITERKRAEEALLRRVQELATLNALGRQVGASLSLDQVVRAALAGVGEALAPDLSLIFLREGDDLILQGFNAPDAKFRHEETPAHRVGQCLCGLAVRQGEALYSEDIHADLRCTWEECKKAGLRSLAALPLRSGEAVIGVLGIASASERDFAERAAFLEALAGQVALGIENARLYEQVHRHAAELEQRVRKRTAELQRFVNLMAGREVRMAELKDVIRELRAQLQAAGLTPAADDPLAGSGG